MKKHNKKKKKQNQEKQMWQNAAAEDILRALGEMSEKEYNYYKNLRSKEEIA